MRLDSLVLKAFDEIDLETNSLQSSVSIHPRHKRLGGDPIYIVPQAEFKGWGIRILNILKTVFGENSIHYQEFSKKFTRSTGEIEEFEICKAIFNAAKKDYCSGYLFSSKALAKAEVVDDILGQAKELLNAGFKDASCILVGVSLEITLRELILKEGLSTGSIENMNVNLYKANVYSLAKQKQITAWAELRNKSAHGQWDEYDFKDVDLFLEGVNKFIGDYL